jgi:hypothetical protein
MSWLMVGLSFTAADEADLQRAQSGWVDLRSSMVALAYGGRLGEVDPSMSMVAPTPRDRIAPPRNEKQLARAR